MYRYLFHGSVGTLNRVTQDVIYDYEDVMTNYESTRPLNVNDSVDFALAYMSVKSEYQTKLLSDGRMGLLTSEVIFDVMSCGLTEVPEPEPMVIDMDDLGVKSITFTDGMQQICRLQRDVDSQNKTVLFGINKVEAQYLQPNQGWKTYRLPEHFRMNGLMRLDQHQVRDLLPHLHRFVETGDL